MLAVTVGREATAAYGADDKAPSRIVMTFSAALRASEAPLQMLQRTPESQLLFVYRQMKKVFDKRLECAETENVINELVVPQ